MEDNIYSTDPELNVFAEQEEEIQGIPSHAASTTAAQAAFVIGDGAEEAYFNIRQDLLMTGASQDVKDISEFTKIEEETLDREAATDVLIDPAVPTNAKEDFLQGVRELQIQRNKTPLYQSYANATVNTYDAGGAPAYAQQQAVRALELQEMHEANAEIEFMKPEVINLKEVSFDSPSTDFWFDVLDLSIPRSHANKITGLYTHMMGEEPSMWDEVWTGEQYHTLKDTFRSLGSKEKVKWAQKMVSFLKEQEGWVKDHNGFEAMVTVEAMLDTVSTEDDFDWDRLIENIIVPLDVITLAGWAKLGLNGITSTLGVANRTNPVLARELAAVNILRDTSEATEAFGQSVPHMLMDTHFPGKGTGAKVLEGAPVDVIDAAAEMGTKATNILGRYQTDNPTTARLIKDIVERNAGGRIHVNKSGATALGGGKYNVITTIGATAARGYTTVHGALSAAKRRRHEGVSLWKRAPSGKIVKVKQDSISSTDKGEYFYQTETVEHLPTETPYVDFAAITPSVTSVVDPRLSKYFTDVNGLFAPKDSLKLGALNDFEASVLSQINNIDRSFKGLSQQDRLGAVTLMAKGAIDRGDGVPGVIRWEDAIAGTDSIKPVTPASYKAYLGMVTKSDLTYLTMNRRVKQGLLDGAFDALHELDGVITYGKLLEASTDLSSVRTVLDITTGRPTALTAEIKTSVENRIGQIFKLRSEERVGGEGFNYMYVPPNGLKQVKSIPDDPLPYIDGYVFTRHEDKYYIELSEMLKIDGGATLKGRTHVKGAANSINEANSLLTSLKEEFLSPSMIADGATMNVRFGREVIKDLNDGESAFELAMANGLLHKGKRGALLEKDGGGLSNILPTFEAMQSSVHKAASHLSKIPVVEKMEKGFVDFFGKQFADRYGLDLLAKNNDGIFSFPLTSKGILVPKRPDLLPLYNNAVAAWDYVNRMGRYEDPVTAGWRGALTRLAVYIDGKTGGTAAHKTADILGKKDPMDAAKSYAFFSFLATNPFRQLPLQMSQHLMLAPLAPLYMGSGKHLIDASSMIAGSSIRHNASLWSKLAPAFAKARGLSLKEFGKEVDEWLDTGLSQSVDSHQFTTGLMPEPINPIGRSLAGQTGAHAANVALWAPRMARKFGFNAGEVGNLASTYMVLKHLNKRAGKTVSPLELGQTTRQMTFSMTESGAFGYQRGLLKNATQFLSFQHKALAAILGQNPSLSKGQRASIATTQTLMFGASAWGVSSVVNGIADKYTELTESEINPDIHRIITEGGATLLINKGLESAGELYGLDKKDYKGTYINFSSFAPFGGATFAVGSIFDMIFADKSGIESMFGASAAAIRRTSVAVNDVMDMFGEMGEDDIVEEVLLESLKVMGRGMSSGLNNYHKGMIAADVRAFIDKHGDETVKATLIEAWAKASLGLGSYKESVYYEAKHNLSLQVMHEKETAKRIVGALFHLYDARKDDDSLEDIVSRAKDITSWLYSIKNESRGRVRALVAEMYLDKLEVREGSSDLLQELMKRAAIEMDVVNVSRTVRSLANDEELPAYEQILDELFVQEPEQTIEKLEGDK